MSSVPSGFSVASMRRALDRNRTCDLRYRKPVLYPLSYEGNTGSTREDQGYQCVACLTAHLRTLAGGGTFACCDRSVTC